MLLANNYNPDVLTCLANLSNDEVFTPPQVVSQMLDMLPAELFRSTKTTFLDPVSKSGVFLREIAKRLMAGLADEIPDIHERADHIFTHQLYGIGITELTSYLSRRSVYCSKYANGRYSVCTKFKDEQGNIRFRPTEHTFVGGRCSYCGASEDVFGPRVRTDLESHAYEFIHTNDPEKLFKNMKFDVIIGNPPYQLDTAGAGRQARPIYNLFVEQAKKLNPRFLSMIIPSRWFAGGIGLDEFRDTMKADKRIHKIVDYANAKDCFPQNSISGGVCYFLWERDYNGPCDFVNISGQSTKTLTRYLDEYPVLVRYNDAISIIHKVLAFNETSLSTIVGSLMPYGLSTNVRGRKIKEKGDYALFASDGVTYIKPDEITKGFDTVDKYKVLISKVSSEHAGEPGRDGKFKVLTTSTKVIGPKDVCTHSYLLVGNYDEKATADNLCEYLYTSFVRFLVWASMSSINISKAVFTFVPLQDFSHPWTDAMLYEKYDLTDEEIAFIESMIRPME